MAKQLPAVLKNFNVFVDFDSYAGSLKTIELPEIVKKTEEYRGAGMLGDIVLDMGFEKLELTVTYTGIDPRHFSQLAKCDVSGLPIRFIGAYERQDICLHTVREISMRGMMTEMPLGEMALGEINEQEIKYGVTYIKVVDDGYELLELDLVNGIYKVGGVDKSGGVNSLLGL